MKITIMFQSFHSGGVEQILINIANELCNYHEITVVTMNAEGELKTSLSESIRIVDFKKKKAIKTIGPLIKYIKSNKPDIILSAKHFINIAVLISNMMLSKKIKVIATVHGQLGTNIKDIMMKLFIKTIYPLSDCIICVSNGVAEEMSTIINDRYSEKIKVIYNPVIDKQFIYKVNESNSIELEKPSNEKWIVSIGRISKEKNLELLIKSFNKIPDKENTKLIIIGDGPEKENIENLVFKLGLEKEVIFKGYQKNPYIYLKNADVFVLSSDREGLPTVLIEALFFKVHIVSTDCKSGPREILSNGKYGKLVPVNDSDKLAVAIDEQLNSKIKNGFDQKILEPFTLDTVMKSYRRIIKEMGG